MIRFLWKSLLFLNRLSMQFPFPCLLATWILALVDVGVNDFLDLTHMFTKDNFSGKDKLVALKDRYIELKNQDLDRLAK